MLSFALTFTDRLRRTALASALVCLAAPPGLRAQQADVVRGRVTGLDSLPLQGVRVTATSYLGGVQKAATTDRSGVFTLIFINGEGDYWLYFTKVGYAPKRFEIKKLGDEAVLIADTRLSMAAAALDKMDVVGAGNRRLPSRNTGGADVGGGDRSLDANVVTPDQAGNLAAMAATVAGVQLIPGLDGASDAFSMLGLSSDQNNTTFEGLGSGVTALPPDLLAATSLRPYPFDPSIGGFSGAQVSIATLPGSNFSRRSVTTAAIVPPLEWADRSATAQGRKFTNARLGGNAAGPIAVDRAFYNLAYNVGRQFSALRTLANTGAPGLIAAGLAPDSVARFMSILRQQHAPTGAAGSPSSLVRDVAQGAVNLDFSPSGSGTGHSFTVAGAANYLRTQPVTRGSALFATPTTGSAVSSWGASGAVVHMSYFGFGVLSRTVVGAAGAGSRTAPNERLPEGRVRIQSSLPDGSAAVVPVSFGGGSAAARRTTGSLEVNNQLSWFSVDARHALKVSSGVLYDTFDTADNADQFGTFNYNSLSDLAAGVPASFARTLRVPSRDGRQIAGSASLGDAWRPSDNFQLQYGVRIDANRLLTRPAPNDDVARTFHLSNAALPNAAYLSPRAGLQWFYGKSPQLAYVPGSVRLPRAVVHAGVGVFQNLAAASLIGSALGATGLPSSTQSIACVGTAAPPADWQAFQRDANAIPEQCNDGSAGTVFATTAPDVALFDPRFRQARSLRAAVDWSGPIFDNRFVLGAQAISSTGLDQSDQFDVNLNPTQRFTLASEGNRPVFVDPNAIVPTTGAAALSGSRMSSAYQHVWLTRSDLGVRSEQVSVNLKPVTTNALLHWELTYTLSNVRESFNGFTSTAGNPFDVAWGPSLQGGHHTLSLAWNNFPVADIVYLSAAMQLVSGPRYTPMVAADVNGDGSLNDRAFIADPAHATDTAFASAIRSLLATGAPSARACLARQLNTLAARGSCQAPWIANTAFLIKFNPAKIGLPKRATVTLSLQNLLGLADLALHPSGDQRGWGQNVPPDQNLLFVRGFDPAARRFAYEVNERFGSTRPQQAATYALPFVSVGVSIDVGVPRERQVLTQRLDLGRRRAGTKTSAAALGTLGMSTIPNPFFLILQQGDSLRLTRGQADSLAALSRAFAQVADSVWGPTSRELASLPDDYRTGDAYARYVAARRQTVDFLLTVIPTADRILTPSQRRRLPREVANYLDARVLRFLRTSTAGDGGAVMIR